jgi:hypothetical protein
MISDIATWALVVLAIVTIIVTIIGFFISTIAAIVSFFFLRELTSQDAIGKERVEAAIRETSRVNSIVEDLNQFRKDYYARELGELSERRLIDINTKDK